MQQKPAKSNKKMRFDLKRLHFRKLQSEQLNLSNFSLLHLPPIDMYGIPINLAYIQLIAALKKRTHAKNYCTFAQP